jgi:glucose-6-phosphate 1-dehydrogenase
LPDDHVIVLFGATGDLAKRKLLPGLFHLARAGLLPKQYRIVGSAPKAFAMTDQQFKDHAESAVAEFGLAAPKGKAWDAFVDRLSFGVADPDDFEPLVHAVAAAERAIGGSPKRLFHLAVPPAAFASVIKMLGDSGLADDGHVIVEKPFGTDLDSARALNATIHSVFDESQVFRIDHFLGKESIDNILALRFANGFFEPVWNRNYITHIEIDVPESISIEGRVDFYEKTGAFKDMVVTHLFQVLGFVAMEPPTALDGKQLQNEKSKAFDALQPIDPKHVVRGQYKGYRETSGCDPRSDCETFVALKCEIKNWRWEGVPFYLRTGKSMASRRQTITIGFKRPTLEMFKVNGNVHGDARGNELIIDFDDPGWIAARFLAKEPGPDMKLGAAEMTFQYADSFRKKHELEGYERLILCAMLGDQTLFTRADGIERLWEVSMPLLENPPPVEMYEPGSWGPDSIKKLIAPHQWYLPDGRPSS